jgi:hypothetical protein
MKDLSTEKAIYVWKRERRDLFEYFNSRISEISFHFSILQKFTKIDLFKHIY